MVGCAPVYMVPCMQYSIRCGTVLYYSTGTHQYTYPWVGVYYYSGYARVYYSTVLQWYTTVVQWGVYHMVPTLGVLQYRYPVVLQYTYPGRVQYIYPWVGGTIYSGYTRVYTGRYSTVL